MTERVRMTEGQDATERVRMTERVRTTALLPGYSSTGSGSGPAGAVGHPGSPSPAPRLRPATPGVSFKYIFAFSRPCPIFCPL